MGSPNFVESASSLPLTPLPTPSPLEDPMPLGIELPPATPVPGRGRWWRWLRWLGYFLLAVFALIGLATYEARTSYVQSRWLPQYAGAMTYSLAPGHSTAVRYPLKGPFDQRLGYVRLPSVLDKLEANGFLIEQQARMSPEMLELAESTLYVPYREKYQAGLQVIDSESQSMYDFRYPRQVFTNFDEIPPLMVEALLFIEDRHLLDGDKPRLNPAVNWGRFLKAILFKAGEVINIDTPSMGGSTLATQIEKYRHSENGVTTSAEEKIRQMLSASVRVYQQGADTMQARRLLVLDYMNTVPLSAAPGFGEVNGIGDGLHVWFATPVDEVVRSLRLQDPKGPDLDQQGLALRRVMALMIAHRRPSYYLVQNREDLSSLVDSHLRVLGRKGVISMELMQAALAQPLFFRNFRQNPAAIPVVASKGVTMVRNRLNSLLDVSLYDLDRLDLTAYTTLNKDLQGKVTQHLHNLQDENVARTNGLVGEYLLKPGQSKDLRYSFTLFERTPDGNRVRVQTDNTDIPFDINEGSKLELGSTAKLRVLSSYLGIIAELYQRMAVLPAEELAKLEDPDSDQLTRWVLEQLRNKQDLSLEELLQSALERRYSASPAEVFFTGGGAHTFNNFKREDNNRIPTVRESLQESLNLPFVRMLREIISHITYQQWSDVHTVLKDDNDPRRKEVLERFIDREGILFLSRFWSKYAGKSKDESLDIFLTGITLTPVRAAVIHRALFPEGDLDSFVAFMAKELAHQPMDRKALANLYERYGPDRYNLQDQGYLARVHPLELWLLSYLMRESNPSFARAMEASKEQRQEVYGWLLRTKAKNARDSRIRSMLEVEAFTELHRRWRQLGYPFEHLVPSLATALGSSGDRPAALAELMGIILNGGERLPAQRLTKLVFATDTPYETHVVQPPAKPEMVMNPAVARALKGALASVVANGTARRLQGQFHNPDGSPLIMGAKTGTGDNRLVVNSGGQKIKARALSRTATLVFYLGDNHFGTLTAFVMGDAAKDFAFTSALPGQVLKGMAPILEPYLQARMEKARVERDSLPHAEYWDNATRDDPSPPLAKVL